MWAVAPAAALATLVILFIIASIVSARVARERSGKFTITVRLFGQGFTIDFNSVGRSKSDDQFDSVENSNRTEVQSRESGRNPREIDNS